ncbi:MAG: DUF533 domain-containing protein [Pseudomonadales bacterium]|nr:DUF533 domain-containing protein [Pseudomonadales bacterium]MBP9034822.1 DUF533 domain-containing protein [Pseudomonadales bacterium]
MSHDEIRSIITIALMAAFADGMKDERERAAVKQLAEALDSDGSLNLAALYRDVLMARPDLATVAGTLQSTESRQLAYEMAVGVCDADDVQDAAEREFLARLATALGLPASQASAISAAADAIAAAASVPEPSVVATAASIPGPSVAAAAPPAAPSAGTLSQAEMDKLILDAAITNAALELLPESLSSLAIIPLQMRLVYRIGKSWGYEMDRSHAKDFLATLGVGLTSQYLEQAGRKLLGGLLGSIAGGLGRGLGKQAASSGLTFATTYALGRVAERYYAGGRTLDTGALKATFTGLLEEARIIAPRYQEEIVARSRGIDTRQLTAMIGKF